MKITATPETDKLIRTQLARVGITPTALASKLTLKCEDLECQRNLALSTLKTIRFTAQDADLRKLADDAIQSLENADVEARR